MAAYVKRLFGGCMEFGDLVAAPITLLGAIPTILVLACTKNEYVFRLITVFITILTLFSPLFIMRDDMNNHRHFVLAYVILFCSRMNVHCLLLLERILQMRNPRIAQLLNETIAIQRLLIAAAFFLPMAFVLPMWLRMEDRWQFELGRGTAFDKYDELMDVVTLITYTMFVVVGYKGGYAMLSPAERKLTKVIFIVSTVLTSRSLHYICFEFYFFAIYRPRKLQVLTEYFSRSGYATEAMFTSFYFWCFAFLIKDIRVTIWNKSCEFIRYVLAKIAGNRPEQFNAIIVQPRDDENTAHVGTKSHDASSMEDTVTNGAASSNVQIPLGNTFVST